MRGVPSCLVLVIGIIASLRSTGADEEVAEDAVRYIEGFTCHENKGIYGTQLRRFRDGGGRGCEMACRVRPCAVMLAP